MTKREFLDQLDASLASQLEFVEQYVVNLEADQLLQSPGNSRWNTAQCLAHLNYYHAFYIPRVEAALAKARLQGEHEQVPSSWIGRVFTRMMDPDTGKRKMKTFKGAVPPADPDPKETVTNFLSWQQKLRHLLAIGAGKEMHHRIPTTITRLITFPACDVLSFLIAHQERHLRQIGRIVAANPMAGAKTGALQIQ